MDEITASEIEGSRISGEIRVSDFKGKNGKYVTIITDRTEENTDHVIKISPKIELRLTYIIKKDEITAIKIKKYISTKSDNKLNQELSLSSVDCEKLIQILKTCSGLDFKSIANGELILEKNIIDTPSEVMSLLKTIESNPGGKEQITEFINSYSQLTPGDISFLAKKKQTIKFFERLLDDQDLFNRVKKEREINQDELVWKRFFEANSWIFGLGVVKVLNNARIDESNIADILIKNIEGYVDIVELKLPNTELWRPKKDKPISQIPQMTNALADSIMQCMRYVDELSKRSNDHKKIEELGCEIVKPRITLVIGRSKNWNSAKGKALRLLNSSFHNIVVITYDMVLDRARRIVSALDKKIELENQPSSPNQSS